MFAPVSNNPAVIFYKFVFLSFSKNLREFNSFVSVWKRIKLVSSSRNSSASSIRTFIPADSASEAVWRL